MYIGLPNNPQFLGVVPPEQVAETINASIGPSGENRDYLLHLEEALTSLSPSSRDEHISDLARRVRNMAIPDRTLLSSSPTDTALKRVHSTEEQEEIEKLD